jgi:hypothetical protein
VGVTHKKVNIFLQPEFRLPSKFWKRQFRAAGFRQKGSCPPQDLKTTGSSVKDPEGFREGCSLCLITCKDHPSLILHYLHSHFKERLSEKWLKCEISSDHNFKLCPMCPEMFENRDEFIFHLGIGHKLVESYLEEPKKRTVEVVSCVSEDEEDIEVSLSTSGMDQISIKTPNPKCRFS